MTRHLRNVALMWLLIVTEFAVTPNDMAAIYLLAVSCIVALSWRLRCQVRDARQ